MVITSRKLQDSMGICPEIADYFANNRAIPTDNLFWEKKRVYIASGFGYLTIPLMFDLVHKLGVPAEVLLDDGHVTLMEKGFHNLKRYEKGEIAFEEFLDSCQALLAGKIKQVKLTSDLFDLFSGKPPMFFKFETNHKALARSDSFLFTLVDLELTDEWVTKFLPVWYSLARPILLLDDFKDLIEDRQTKDSNTIIELGNNSNAIKAAYQLGVDDLNVLSSINPKLSEFMLLMLNDALRYKHIQSEMSN